MERSVGLKHQNLKLGPAPNVPLLFAQTQVQNGNRKCTDFLFLLLLFMAWAAMTMLGLIVTGVIPHDGLEPGNPKRLINGIDYEGRICGVGTQVQVNQRPLTSGSHRYSEEAIQ